ncbi:MAG: hypothetical protein HY796_03165 [Elusimicrobia bacterium]|nr:hypothetical protein [Elusimicrobiota bacterium]
MRVEKDFEDLIKCLNRHKVEYCIVGGFAVIYYTIPRYTGDLDILIRPTRENAKRTLSALKKFGVGPGELGEKDVAYEGKIIEIGRPPIMVHLITKIDGAGPAEIWKNIVKAVYGKETAYFIGLEELKKNKRACSLKTGRKRKDQDKLDLKMLQKFLRRDI